MRELSNISKDMMCCVYLYWNGWQFEGVGDMNCGSRSACVYCI